MVRFLRIAATAVGLAACVWLATNYARGPWQRRVLQWMGTNPQYLAVGSTGHMLGVTVEPRLFLTVEVREIEPYPYFHKEPLPTQLGCYFWNDGSFAFLAPIWLLIVLMAAASGAPWFRWRFGVRTVLLAITAVAVLLGALVTLDH